MTDPRIRKCAPRYFGAEPGSIGGPQLHVMGRALTDRCPGDGVTGGAGSADGTPLAPHGPYAATY